MNRQEIKELAKSKIKGNLWNILWPMLIVMVIEGIVTAIFTPQVDTTTLEATATMTPTGSFITSLVSIACGIFMAAYLKYVLDFVRTGKLDTKTIMETLKAKWLNIFVADLVMGILVTLASLLLVIPGIILALAYAMVNYIVIDSDLTAIDALKRSREMMKGYKWDYFVFSLSFIGWIILVPFTFGILCIWLVPYITVAETIYYDRLKDKK